MDTRKRHVVGRTLAELKRDAEAIGYVIEKASPLAVRMSLKKCGRRAKWQLRPLGETSEIWLDPCLHREQVRTCLIDAYSLQGYRC